MKRIYLKNKNSVTIHFIFIMLIFIGTSNALAKSSVDEYDIRGEFVSLERVNKILTHEGIEYEVFDIIIGMELADGLGRYEFTITNVSELIPPQWGILQELFEVGLLIELSSNFTFDLNDDSTSENILISPITFPIPNFRGTIRVQSWTAYPANSILVKTFEVQLPFPPPNIGISFADPRIFFLISIVGLLGVSTLFLLRNMVVKRGANKLNSNPEAKKQKYSPHQDVLNSVEDLVQELDESEK